MAGRLESETLREAIVSYQVGCDVGSSKPMALTADVGFGMSKNLEHLRRKGVGAVVAVEREESKTARFLAI